MSVIDAERIAKTYEPFDIFWDVSCSVAWGDRIALVGRNGTGKTTLLRILAGLEPAHQRPGAPRQGAAHRLPAPGGLRAWRADRDTCGRR